MLRSLYGRNAAVRVLLGLDLFEDLRVEGGSGEDRPAGIYGGQCWGAGARDVARVTTFWVVESAGR